MSALGQLGGRLYRGEVSFNFVGRRRLWYAISGLILLISIVAVLVRGLSFSVDFKGGAVFTFPSSSTSVSQVQSAVESGGVSGAIVQQTHGQKNGWQIQNEVADRGADRRAGEDAVQQARRELQRHHGHHRRPELGQPDLGQGAGGADRVPDRDRDLPVDRLRAENGDRGVHRAAARPRDRHRNLRAGRLPGQPGDRHRIADHPRLLAVRHRGGLRQGAGEHGRSARRRPHHLQPGG